MTWQDALAKNLAAGRARRFEWLCSDANPDAKSREGYRRLMVRLATRPVVSLGPVRPNPVTVDYGLPARPPGKCCG